MNFVEHDTFAQLWIVVDEKTCKKCELEWNKVLYDVENKFGFTK